MSPLRLEKRIPEKSQFRFYRLEVQPTLFGEWSLIREWGRIGRQGRVVVDTFTTQAEARLAFEGKAIEKLRRGYHSMCGNAEGASRQRPNLAANSLEMSDRECSPLVTRSAPGAHESFLEGAAVSFVNPLWFKSFIQQNQGNRVPFVLQPQ